MDPRAMARQLPLRLSAGVFLLNSGLAKRDADEESAGQTHGFAATAYPFLHQVEPRRFVRLLSAGETAIGAALLVPVVPAAVAGAGLTAFSLGTLGLYLRVPGLRQEGSLRPSEQGIAIAKDVWMLGIGVALVVDGLLDGGGPSRRAGRRGGRRRR